MGAYLWRRSGQALVAFLGLIGLVFVLARFTGDPARLYLPLNASAAAREAFRVRQGFDDPIWLQLANYVGDLIQLDFGESLRRGSPALDIVLNALPATLWLVLVTTIVVMTASLVMGTLAAYRPDSIVGRFTNASSVLGASLPDFWLALVGVLLFANVLGWVPTSGTSGWQSWLLPVAVLAARPFGVVVQVVRSSVASTLTSPYVATARIKGLRERVVLFRHSLRNASLPIITVGSDQLAGLLNGAVIVETIFAWPGIGRLMINAILQRDFAVLQATVIVAAGLIFVMNFLVDLGYAVLDPRVRLEV